MIMRPCVRETTHLIIVKGSIYLLLRKKYKKYSLLFCYKSKSFFWCMLSEFCMHVCCSTHRMIHNSCGNEVLTLIFVSLHNTYQGQQV